MIGDDESAVPSGAVTPRKEIERTLSQSHGEGASAEQDNNAAGENVTDSALGKQKAAELPSEVKVKLRKLDRLEGRYQELLRAYRTAHSRVQMIEPFEASLRELTPLTSISDPEALMEYLNQSNLKSDMALDELKRVSADRDDWKRKSEEAEKSTKSTREELERIKTENAAPASNAQIEKDGRPSLGVATTSISGNGETPQQSASAQSPTPSQSSRVASFSLFSPKSKAVKSPPLKPASEDFFSYDTEIPRLEIDLAERQKEIESLKKQLENMKGDLAVTRESTEGMVQSLESATRELHSLRDGNDKHESEKATLQQEIKRLENDYTLIMSDKVELQREIKNLQSNHDSGADEGAKTSAETVQAQESLLHETTNQLELCHRRLEESEKTMKDLKGTLSEKESIVKDLEDSLALKKSDERLQEAAKTESELNTKKVDTLNNVLATLRLQLKDADSELDRLRQQLKFREEEHATTVPILVYERLKEIGKSEDKWEDKWAEAQYDAKRAYDVLYQKIGLDDVDLESTPQPTSPLSLPGGALNAPSKKKNKKKRKGKAAQDHVTHGVPVKATKDLGEGETATRPEIPTNQTISQLKAQVEGLQKQLDEKNALVNQLVARLKDQDALKEEIETLRDDLLQQGEEHVEARDQLKTAVTEKNSLMKDVEGLQKELSELKAERATGAVNSEKAHQDLLSEFEELNTKATTLQTDLNAAQQLAAARFKDISDLRDLLSKAQPELRKLRQENKDLASAKEELKNKTGELHRLESRHEDLKAEMKGLGKRLSDQDFEIKKLHSESSSLTTARSKAAEELQIARSDLRTINASKQAALSSQESTAKDLTKAKEEGQELRKKVRTLEEQIEKLRSETQTLQEEIQLKTAQHASAESLMSSMRDQTAEMSTQMREATARADALEEELSETQRMLSERSREGETMRRLLNDVETSSERKVREMKERMETAVEERDRAEDEASMTGRRMARELEDLRTRVRDTTRAAKRAEDEKDELEHEQRAWKRRRDELESQAERSSAEITEVRSAMAQLRDALDEAEQHAQDLERQKGELKHAMEESQHRLEKLQKSNRSLSEEVKNLRGDARKPPAGSNKPGLNSGVNSSRSSTDSRTVGSPVPPRERTPAVAGPNAATGIDYVYLKNVLLQFLEQRDKNHQKQLVPVLGMLLHFDR